MKNNIKGLIFDYGGTLDSHGTHWFEIIADGYRHAGLEVPREELRQSYATGERTLALQRIVMPEDNFLDTMRKKIRIEIEDLERRGVVSGSDLAERGEVVARYCYEQARAVVEENTPVVRALRERYPLVLVSNFYGNVNSVIADMGIAPLFDAVIESAVVGVRKPDPAIFGLGVEALGMKPEEVVVIGDSYRKDIAPARQIGCHTVWLKGQGWEEAPDEIPAQVQVISSLQQLPEAIKKITEE